MPQLGTTHLRTLKDIKKFDEGYKLIPRKTQIPRAEGGSGIKCRSTKLDICTYLDRPFIPIIRLNHNIDVFHELSTYIHKNTVTVTVDTHPCKSTIDDSLKILRTYRPKTLPLVIFITERMECVNKEVVAALQEMLTEEGVVMFLGPTVTQEDNIYKAFAEELGSDYMVFVTKKPITAFNGDLLTVEYEYNKPIVVSVSPTIDHFRYGGIELKIC